MRLTIFGDSHAVALGRGLLSLKEQGRLHFPGDISILKILNAPQANKKFHTFENGRLIITGEPTRSLFTQLVGREYLASDNQDTIFGCSLGFTTTRFFRFDMWGSHTMLPSLASRKRFVSEGVVEAMFLSYNQLIVDFYRDFKKLGLRCFAIAAPPPQINDPAVAGGVTPEEILRIDNICRAAFTRELSKIGIPCVSPPASVYSGDMGHGFLKPEYAHERESDFHHGNQLFGEVMLNAVIEDVIQRFGANQSPQIMGRPSRNFSDVA